MCAHPAFQSHDPGGRLFQLFAQPVRMKHRLRAAAVADEQCPMVCGVMVLACMDVVAVLRADMRRQTVGQWLSHPVTLQQSQWKLPMLAVHTWHRPQRLPQPVNAVLQLEGGA